ncbi:hypothetical protein BsWGS_07828 [Bradybaena similaris]
MNVYFILLGLLSGAVPTDVVVPARNNLLPAHMKPHRQSAPVIAVRPDEDNQMKDASVRRWAQEYIGQTITLERYRRKRAGQPKTRSTAGLEKDTDDPDGVYRTLDELKSMKPGPGVQRREEMPVMSKENAAELKRKKRSRQITTNQAVTNLNQPYESNIKYWHKLFSQKDDDRKNKMKTNMKYMKLHVKTNRLSDGPENVSVTHYNGFSGGLKHSADKRSMHTKTVLHHLENHDKLSTGGNTLSSNLSALSGTGVKNDFLKDMWYSENVKVGRNGNHRTEREAESGDRASDSTDVSADSDQWWGKKLDYIDSRNSAGYRTKPANNTDNLESTSEQRRTAISLRGVIAEEKPPQTTSKQSLQSEISANTDSKGDDWLKNELMLIEIESRALKRKAAQLHNKLRKANLNWKNSDSASMYVVDSPRQDVVETYSRLNKRVENDGIGPRLGRMQNVQATEHKIQRKQRLAGYSGGLRADIADAVIKLDNDLADLKARIMIRSERERLRSRDYYMRPRFYRDVYSAAGDHDDYESDHSTGRYRRNVNDNILRQLDKLHLFISGIRDLSSSPRIKSTRYQSHNCQHGSASKKLRRKDKVKYTKVREQEHNTGTRNINTNTFIGVSGEHIESTPNNQVPTLIQMSSLYLCWNTSLNCLHLLEPMKGKYPITMKGRAARIIISLAKILQDISTHRRVDSHKYPSLNTHYLIWRDKYKTASIPGNSQSFTTPTRMSNRHPTNIQFNIFVLTMQADATSGGNEVLNMLKTTLRGDLKLIHTWTYSSQLTTDRISKHMLKDIQSGTRSGPRSAIAKVKNKWVDKLQISLPSRESKKHLAQPTPDSDQTQEQLSLNISAKVDHRNRVHLNLYLRTLCRPLLKIHTKWSRRQVSPRVISVNCNRLTLNPSMFVLYNCSNSDLHTKYTGKVDFVWHHRPRTTSLRFMPFPKRGHIQYIRRLFRLRHPSNFPNGLAAERPLANRMEQNGKEESLVIILQTAQQGFYQRTMHSYGRETKIYASLRMRLNLCQLASNFRNNGFLIKRVGHETFVTTPQFINTGLTSGTAFKNNVRSKRSSDEVNADPETVDEISLKEDLENLFKKFPVSDSEKLLNSELQQAEDAELASADMGRFIMQRNKDTEGTQNVLPSESRFRRHLQALEDHAERTLEVDNQKYWFLGAILRRKLKSLGESEYVRRSNSALQSLGNISNTFLKDSLDEQNYSNSSHTRDNSEKSMKLATDTNKVNQNRTTYTISKLVSLLRTGVDRIWLRFPRRAHRLKVSRKLSTPCSITSAHATSEDRNFPHRYNCTTDKKQYVSQSPINSSNSNDISTSETNMKTDKFPETGFTVEPRNGENVTSETSLQNLHNFSNHSEVEDINGAEQTLPPGPLKLNSSYQNFTNGNTQQVSPPPNILLLNSSYQNVTNANNVTRTFRLPSTIMPNSSYRNFTNVNQKGFRLPASAMINSTNKNFTNINSAMKEFMKNSTDRNITEFNKALKTYMTNTTSGKKPVVGEKPANISGGAGQGQKSIADYFDNNANVEVASGADDGQIESDKSTDTQEEKEKAEKPEAEEGIQVDVKGKKVEPTEPFAFIEKDEAKKPTEYQYTWAEWSECSVTCGLGQRFRTNRCGDQPCAGDKASSETEVCSMEETC